MEPSLSDLFDQYRNAYGGELRAFLRDRIDPETAEDLLQETWARFSVTLRTEPPLEVRAWLYRVLRNLLADEYRRRSRRPVFSDLDALTPIPAEADAEREEDPEFWIRLEEALERLPPLQAEVFIRNELEGETLAEIAESRGESLKTIISRKQYARKKLRQLLDSYDDRPFDAGW